MSVDASLCGILSLLLATVGGRGRAAILLLGRVARSQVFIRSSRKAQQCTRQ